ncbi:hypothetical protein E4T44_08551 [Aureobasidium sp. EXF-8845]|nr:hypothetical protein E4T44_08551 [Aureobasidium sp. EXF-8845]KAI4843708.1 hypothetical protein E4T45_08484 [Aureobasidium sp. EXF-8846]
MDRFRSHHMPPVGRNAAAAVPVVPSRKARNYRDYDYVPTGPRALNYDEHDLAPSIKRHKRVVSHRKRHNSHDGYHLVLRGSDHSGRRLQTNTAPPFNSHETLEQARTGKSPELQRLPTNRKRNADSEETRQHSYKRLRGAKNDRSDRLCLQCGNYHSSPCYVPLCSACDFNHYHNIPCLDAMEKLKGRLELHSPPAMQLSSEQQNQKSTVSKSCSLRHQDESHVPRASADFRAPTTSFKTVSQSFSSGQKKGSPGKRTCPVCHECGSLHRSPCKWVVCEACKVKHHPETPCAVAEARLKRRLEEEDEKQAQVAEDIEQQAQDMVEMNNKMASTGLQFRRSSAPSPGRAFSPGVEPRKVKTLKKGTRFCRDCGRYLNGPCTWPTCGECGTKHLARVACWKAQQTLQNRLDMFDRGYGTSQIPKVKPLPQVLQPSSMNVEPPTKVDHPVPATPVTVTTPVNMTFNISSNEQMSWSLDSNTTIHLGLPPRMPGFSVSTPSMSQQTNSHVHPDRQALLLQPSEGAAPGPQPLVDIRSTRSVMPLDDQRDETSQAITYGASVERNVDAFIADVVQAMQGNGHIAMRYVNGPQGTPSYLEYLRRNS